jgi:UDP:flavonoid glycosyltransferase YjiC (YdhE family)
MEEQTLTTKLSRKRLSALLIVLPLLTPVTHSAGVPHIVLPCWYDTYQYAARVEWLGIGIFANKSTAPGANGKEFGDALISVTSTANQTIMTKKAKDLAAATAKYGGRKRAAQLLAEAADRGSRFDKETKMA